MRYLWIMLASLGAAAGCGPNLADVIEEHRAAATAKLQQIDALEAVVKKAPAVDDTTGAPKLEGSLTLVDSYKPGPVGVLHIRDFPVSGDSHEINVRVGDEEWFEAPSALLRTGQYSGLSRRTQVEDAREHFTSLAGVELVVVIMRDHYDAPKRVSSGLFTPGGYRAEAHVYRLADATWLGAVKIRGRSSPKVSSPSFRTRSGTVTIPADISLNVDIAMAAKRDLVAKLGLQR